MPSAPRFTILVIFVFAVVTLFFQIKSIERILFANTNTNDSNVSHANTQTRRAKLGDGCYHVFLDIGSNIGIHARFLYEPDLYPDSKSSVPAFEREFGYPRDNRDYCVFSFEPNPKFEARHLELQRAYEEMGWHYYPIIAGASNAEGNMTFYHSAFEAEAWETGFSAVTPTTLYGGNATAKTVKIIRLATWIIDEIQDRIIPNMPHSTHFMEPRVIMKLDIEGLEYRVFPDLLTTGALCNNVHFLMGEFHYGPGNHNYFPINVTTDGRHVLHTRKDGQRLAPQLLHMVDITDTCMTRISLEDDESYLEDPHEYPTPNGTVTAS
eukprot:CAMPEP_0183709508 /NCGR_PEP_ID=MMETSP0737-20130205/5546_1 /TAXON_ID=385413 /ORGANISM="Thalassiosira miniscula, Strain CCMP1093" /LENGTH=322 /DNA_ID=CAMNT_0025937631 /DNA_START=227 /DNA_END=1195 /DNA_ORIENTATION=-